MRYLKLDNVDIKYYKYQTMITEIFRNRDVAIKILKKIEKISSNLRRIKLMHVCGTHEEIISRYGIRSLLPENIEVISGPGCPVCVTTPKEIDEAVFLADKGYIVTTFGDMLRVRGSKDSLEDIKAKGGDVRVVYSPSDAVKIAKKENNEVIHIGIGFETTAPSTAVELRNASENFSFLFCHRLIPPAMDFLLSSGDLRIDGFIDPGHVSTVIGLKPYIPLSRRYNIPQVIAGFEPVDVLMAIFMLLRMIRDRKAEVRNEYVRVVRENGNIEALKLMDESFQVIDVKWRGFPEIPNSGLIGKEKFYKYDARKKFDINVDEGKEPEGCRCGDILKGLIYPKECRLFGKVCKPENPIGPCMVSQEGACAIAYKYNIAYTAK